MGIKPFPPYGKTEEDIYFNPDINTWEVEIDGHLLYWDQVEYCWLSI